jgi:hypothetical protein
MDQKWHFITVFNGMETIRYGRSENPLKPFFNISIFSKIYYESFRALEKGFISGLHFIVDFQNATLLGYHPTYLAST